MDVRRFGGDPLFMARSAWCGIGRCSARIGVIRLSQGRPIACGDILAGATSPAGRGFMLDRPGNTCRTDDVQARI